MKICYNISEVESIIKGIQEKLDTIARLYKVLENEINTIAQHWSSKAGNLYLAKLTNLVNLDFSDFALLVEGLKATNKLFGDAKDKVSSASKRIGV